MTRTALVTGGNRGIGLEVCRQLAEAGYRVILTARDLGQGERQAGRLRSEGHDVVAEVLDVTSPASVSACAERVGAVDILVNNAGIYPTQSFFRVDETTFLESLQVNLIGAWRMCQALVPGMIYRGYGRVVNVSSGLGAVTHNVPSPPAYGIAKAGLNAMTLSLSAAVPWVAVKVNAVCPGWVRTDMGGPAAPVKPRDAADTIVWLATLPDDGPTGGFFRERREIPW
ncbi:SDR family oxidoreductase [Streptosporangium sp. NPDC000396]|uniref:SDR family oxidoreductase n=1 Tax=Streptosporangium sp. NPDC000396 TaxID=3366185 RepID=UPI0036B61BA5